VIGFIPDPKKSDARFIKYLFDAVLKLQYRQVSQGAAQDNLSQGKLLALKFSVPDDVNEQIRIADFIATYDDLIENNRRRIQLLEESARLLYQEWFVHLRFPGHEQVNTVDGLPEGWRNMQLTDIAKVNQASLKKGFDEKIEYIDISCVSTHSISDTTWYEFIDAPGRARRIVQHCDILWSCVRPNRRSHALVWEPHDRLIASTGFAVISATEVSPLFLYQSLTTNEYVGYLTNRAGGAAYPAVTARVFEESSILVPTKNLVEQYERQVQDTYTQINILRTQNIKLAQARDLLLPKLMSGELAV
jgi:type I restriction enzyme S subunit